jgi:hypothetical protein
MRANGDFQGWLRRIALATPAARPAHLVAEQRLVARCGGVS